MRDFQIPSQNEHAGVIVFGGLVYINWSDVVALSWWLVETLFIIVASSAIAMAIVGGILAIASVSFGVLVALAIERTKSRRKAN